MPSSCSLKDPPYYTGCRTPYGCVVLVSTGAGIRYLEPRPDLISGKGFEWGYVGAGPSQLAVALAVDVLRNDDQALRVYDAFKRSFVAGLPCDYWQFSKMELMEVFRTCEPIPVPHSYLR